MIYKRKFLPSVSAPEAGLRIEGGPVLQITPSERYALQLLAQGAPTSQIGAMLGLAPADIDPFLAATVRETRRNKPCRRDQGCFSARLAGAVRRRADAATGTGMSLKTVQLIVGRLVTDEEYRLKFLSDPIRALTTLRDQGVELTSAEIDALIRTDRTLWSDAAARIDPDLQRSSWLAD